MCGEWSEGVGEGVECYLERREIGGQRVDLDGELFAMYVLARGDTGEVEARAGTH